MSIVLRTLIVLGCCCSFASYAAPFPALVDSAWLYSNHNESVVLDVRPRTDFDRGHWPRARWAGFSKLGWQVERYGQPGYLPNENKLAELLGSLGLQGIESVIVIGSAEQPRRIAEATRVVWSLMMAGFRQVALLDGGIESLSPDRLVKDTAAYDSTICNIDFQHELLADTTRVEDLLGNNRPVIDFRPTPYFEGYKRSPQVPAGGTIYDGVGIPPELLLDNDTGRFLPRNIIQQAFARYDIPTHGPLATFSDTGVWAALGWYVLHRILHNPRARLYDGSMVEWIDRGGEVHDSTDDMGGPIG